MTRIRQNATQWIAEDRRRLLERDSVFGQICRSFLRVPLELQRPRLLSRYYTAVSEYPRVGADQRVSHCRFDETSTRGTSEHARQEPRNPGELSAREE